MGISIEGIKRWLEDPVTQEFFSYVEVTREDCDRLVHIALENADGDGQAGLHNAGKKMAEEILGIPERMIDDIKEEEE